MKFSDLRSLFTPGVILAGIVIGSVLTVALAFVLFWNLPSGYTEAPQAALTWIPGPTNTPKPPTAEPPPTSTPTATFAPLQAGEMGIGSYVQISGTGGVGLNIRSSPGLTTNIEFLGYDAEVFEVREGPQEADGYTWWYLVTPVDENRAGWAASDFLELVANP